MPDLDSRLLHHSYFRATAAYECQVSSEPLHDRLSKKKTVQLLHITSLLLCFWPISESNFSSVEFKFLVASFTCSIAIIIRVTVTMT